MSKYPEYLSVNNYISYQPAEHQANLELIRNTILSAVPEALETISYNMPAFKYHGMLCFYAVFKDHYSLFVSPQVRQAFDTELKSFIITKSTIHFFFDKPLPVKLIIEIIRFAAITNLDKAQSRMSKKNQ